MAIGSLAVRVTADTSQYNKRMRKTAGPADKMRKRMGSVSVAAGKMAAKLAAAGVAITGALVVDGMKAVTAQNRLARSLATTNTRVAALTSAFKQYGLDANDVSDALNTLADRAEDASQGTKSMIEDFGLIGLEVDDLRNKSPDELFNTFAKAVANTEDPTKRAAAVVRTLGDDLGRKLMPLLMEGPGALEKYQKQVRALGVSLGAVKSESVERAWTAFGRLGEVLQGVANRLAAKFAPIIEAISKRLHSAAVESNGFQGALETAFSVGVKAVGFFADMLRGLHVVIKGVLVGFQALGTGILSVASMVWEGWQRIFEKIVAGIQMAAEQINKIPFVPDIPLDGIKAYRAQLRGSADDQREMRQRMADSVAQSASELKALANTPMPSDKIDAFVKSITEASNRISEKTVKARQNLGNLANPAGGEGEGSGDKDKKKRMQEQLELMRARLEGERELIKLDYEKKLEQLQVFRENKLITDTEYDELEKQLEAKKQKEITDLAKKGAEARAKAEEAAAERQRNATVTAMNNIVSAVGSGSKKAFKIQQAASISTAVIKGWEAAVNAWNAGMSTGGPYAPAIAAAYMAASLAKTGAQIASIKSQSFGGGGSTSGGGGGGGIPSAGGAGNARTNTGGGDGGTGASYDVTLALQGGSTISDDQLEGVVNRIGEYMKDGGKVSGLRLVRE